MSSSTRIDELWKKFEENPRRFFAPLANEHRKAGDLEQAIAICQQHLPDQPGHISGHIVLAQALLEKGDLAEASNAFQAALALDPENLIALRSMGDIARQVDDLETARLWYERVLDVDPRNDEVNALIREIDAAPVAESADTARWSTGREEETEGESFAATTDEMPAAAESFADGPSVEALDLSPGADEPVGVEASGGTDVDVAPVLDFLPTSHDITLGDEPERSDVGTNVVPSITTPLFEMEGDPESAEFAIDMSAEVPVDAPAEQAVEASAANGHEVAPEFEAWGFDEPETLVQFDDEPGAASDAAVGAPSDAPVAAESIAASHDEWPSLDTEEPATDAPAESGSRAPALEGWPDVGADATSSQLTATPTDADDSWFESEEVSLEAAATEPIAGIEFAEFTSEADASAGAAIDGFMIEEAPGYHLTPADGSTSIAADGVDEAEAADEGAGADVADAPEGREQASAEPAPAAAAAIVSQRPTPSVPSEPVAPAATGFVTETMAELYLQQGYRDEALAVYRELLSQHPGDAALRERVTHLEAGDASSVSIESLSAPRAAGPSARAFFAGVARHSAPARPHAPAPLQPRRATPTVLTSLPASALGAGALDASASDAAARGSLDALFGRTPVEDGAERAAETLASAFEVEAAAGGEPTRAAASELSLDSVFGGTPPSVPATNGGSDFSFDQFFSSPERDDAGAGAPASRSAPGGERPNDIEQFTAWLEGLKRK